MIKKTLFLAAVLLLGAVSGSNLIPNGDLKDVKKRRIDIRLPGKASKVTFSPGNILVESLKKDALAEFNCHRLTGMKKGKRHYMRMSLEVLGFDSSFSNRFSARVIFFDKSGKVMTKNHLFTPEIRVTEIGKNDLFYSFIPPAAAEKCSLTFWLRGVKKARITGFFLSEKLPVNSPDGNLLLNGGLESSVMADFYFRGTSAPPERLFERSAARSKTGRYSLRSYCSNPQKSTEINFNILPFTPGKKYRFSADYFITSASGKNKVAGRVTFWKGSKVVRYMFPQWKSTAGEWHKMALSFYPPANCDRVTITLWFSGKHELFIDDFYYGFEEEKKNANHHAGALIISENPDCTVWKEAPFLKVPYKGVPAGVKKSDTVHLAAAANESEPFQIVVSAQKDMGNTALQFSELKGPKGRIPASALSAKVVGFINLKNPDNPSIRGFNADPLLPEKSAPAYKGKNLPFYVLLKVPAGTAPGSYKGRVHVTAGGKKISSFQIALRVYNFSLPETAFLKSFFYLMPYPNYNRIDKRPRAAMVANFHKLLKEFRMNGNQALIPAAPKIKIADGKLTVTDWSAFDKEIELRSKVYGQTNFPVPYLLMQGDNFGWFNWRGGDRNVPRKSPFGNFNLVSPEGLKYAGQFAAAFSEYVKKKYPHLNFYANIYDEPPAKVHADLKKLLDAIHRAAPEFNVFITKEVNDTIGHVDTFAVPFAPGYCRFPRHREFLRKGGEIWYYNWSVSLNNHNYIVSRLYPWRIYTAQGTGGLLWNTISVPGNINPWHDMEKTHACGGATIFYPPRHKNEGNVPSLRAALIKEGIDDFDYMRILENAIDKFYPGMGRTRVMEILKKVIHTPPFEYSLDPHLLYAVRHKLAEEIEAVKNFPAVITSTPSDNSLVETSAVSFKVAAPEGTEILLNGRKAGKVLRKTPAAVSWVLERLGENKVKIELLYKGKKYTFFRHFVLKADPGLKELQILLPKCREAKIDVSELQAFFKQLKSNTAYTEKERLRTGKLIEKYKRALAVKAFKEKRAFVNELEKFFFKQAERVFTYKQFERSEYYLELAAEAARGGVLAGNKVKVTPVFFKNHAALCLDNGIIRAVILETGGRLVSFKVRGTETLRSGSFDKVMTPEKRSLQQVTKGMFTTLGGYDGYGDAGSGDLWPITYVDWDLKIRELTSRRAALQYAVKLPGTSFLLRRTMTMEAGSPDLKMDYEIVNLMPVDTASDDPEHFQLPWRGRFVPAIGSGKIPQLNDMLVVPAKYADEKLAQSHFTFEKPVNFERPCIRLVKPFMGAFDTKLKKGIAIIGDQVTSHAYVWFWSKGNHLGQGKVYTLEFPRSFFGRKHNDREPNSPLTVKPGRSLNFSITLRGLVHVTSAADLVKQTGL